MVLYMRKILISLALLSIFGLPQATFAWNDVGHMTVAEIAWQIMTPETRTQVSAVLKQHPLYKQMLIEGMPAGANEDEYAFLKAATWPDLVRPSRPGDRQFKDASITRYHHGSWHYADDAIPLPTSTTRPSDGTPAKDLFLPEALEKNRTTLATADADAADRAVALCWVEHLVGDIHQPLHSGAAFTEKYPNGDQGGNALAVNTPSGVFNLHSVWDELLGTNNDYRVIDFLARDILLDPRCDVTKQPGFAEHKTVDAWAAESREQAVAFVYAKGRLATGSMKDFQAKKLDAVDVPMLPPMYLQTAHELARVRVAEAGARLAEVLRASLEKK